MPGGDGLRRKCYVWSLQFKSHVITGTRRINPSGVASFKNWLSRKGWKTVSKLSIKNLGRQWGASLGLSRNSTVKELIPHWEFGGCSVSGEPGHRPTFPSSPFLRQIQSFSLTWVSVFKQEVHLLYPSPPLLWGGFSGFPQGASLKAGPSCLALGHTMGLLTEMFKWPWSLEPGCNPPAQQDQRWWAQIEGHEVRPPARFLSALMDALTESRRESWVCWRQRKMWPINPSSVNRLGPAGSQTEWGWGGPLGCRIPSGWEAQLQAKPQSIHTGLWEKGCS